MKIAVLNISSAFRDPQYVSVKIDNMCNHMDSEVIHNSYVNDDEWICHTCRAWKPYEGDRWFNEDSNEEVR